MGRPPPTTVSPYPGEVRPRSSVRSARAIQRGGRHAPGSSAPTGGGSGDFRARVSRPGPVRGYRTHSATRPATDRRSIGARVLDSRSPPGLNGCNAGSRRLPGLGGCTGQMLPSPNPHDPDPEGPAGPTRPPRELELHLPRAVVDGARGRRGPGCAQLREPVAVGLLANPPRAERRSAAERSDGRERHRKASGRNPGGSVPTRADSESADHPRGAWAPRSPTRNPARPGVAAAGRRRPGPVPGGGRGADPRIRSLPIEGRRPGGASSYGGGGSSRPNWPTRVGRGRVASRYAFQRLCPPITPTTRTMSTVA